MMSHEGEPASAGGTASVGQRLSSVIDNTLEQCQQGWRWLMVTLLFILGAMALLALQALQTQTLDTQWLSSLGVLGYQQAVQWFQPAVSAPVEFLWPPQPLPMLGWLGLMHATGTHQLAPLMPWWISLHLLACSVLYWQLCQLLQPLKPWLPAVWQRGIIALLVLVLPVTLTAIWQLTGVPWVWVIQGGVLLALWYAYQHKEVSVLNPPLPLWAGIALALGCLLPLASPSGWAWVLMVATALGRYRSVAYGVGYVALATVLVGGVLGGSAYQYWVQTQRLPLMLNELIHCLGDGGTWLQLFSMQAVQWGQTLLGLESFELEGSLNQRLGLDWLNHVMMGYRDSLRPWFWLHLGVGSLALLVAALSSLRGFQRSWLGHPWVILSGTLFWGILFTAVQQTVLLRVLPLEQHLLAGMDALTIQLPWVWVWLCYGIALAAQSLQTPAKNGFGWLTQSLLKPVLPVVTLGLLFCLGGQAVLYHTNMVYTVAKAWHEAPSTAQQALLALQPWQSHPPLTPLALVATSREGHPLLPTPIAKPQPASTLARWQQRLQSQLLHEPNAILRAPHPSMVLHTLSEGVSLAQQAQLARQIQALPNGLLPPEQQQAQLKQARWVLFAPPSASITPESSLVRQALPTLEACFQPQLLGNTLTPAEPRLWKRLARCHF